jgi:hypothetical protein
LESEACGKGFNEGGVPRENLGFLADSLLNPKPAAKDSTKVDCGFAVQMYKILPENFVIRQKTFQIAV